MQERAADPSRRRVHNRKYIYIQAAHFRQCTVFRQTRGHRSVADSPLRLVTPEGSGVACCSGCHDCWLPMLPHAPEGARSSNLSVAFTNATEEPLSRRQSERDRPISHQASAAAETGPTHASSAPGLGPLLGLTTTSFGRAEPQWLLRGVAHIVMRAGASPLSFAICSQYTGSRMCGFASRIIFISICAIPRQTLDPSKQARRASGSCGTGRAVEHGYARRGIHTYSPPGGGLGLPPRRAPSVLPHGPHSAAVASTHSRPYGKLRACVRADKRSERGAPLTSPWSFEPYLRRWGG